MVKKKSKKIIKQPEQSESEIRDFVKAFKFYAKNLKSEYVKSIDAHVTLDEDGAMEYSIKIRDKRCGK